MYRFILSLFLSFLLVSSCAPKKQFKEIPYPTLHGQITYFQEKVDQYNSFPITKKDIVLLGDDIFDRGIWNLFYNSSNVKNRGIALEGTECTLFRIDTIAKQSPKSIFISTGVFDLKKGKSTKEILNRIIEIVERGEHFSNETKFYVTSLIPDLALKDLSSDKISYKDSVSLINTLLKKKFKRRFIDITSSLSDSTGYISNYYSFDGVRINGAGYEVIAKILSKKIGLKAHNSISNDPLLSEVKYNSQNELLRFYHTLYNSKYEGHSAHYKARLSIFRSIPNSHKDVIMFGNSLNNNCFWEEQLKFKKYEIINKGISGDEVMDMYLRLDDVIDEKPSYIFMLAGVNNFINNENSSVMEVWNAYKNVLTSLKGSLPKCKLFVFSSIPLNPISKYYIGRNVKVRELNDSLSSNISIGYEYISLDSELIDNNGDLSSVYTFDGIHLNQKAYDIWRKDIMIRVAQQ